MEEKRSWKKTIFYGCILFLIATCVALVFAEVLLRVVARDVVPIYIPDTDTGKIIRPNYHTVRYIPESDNKINITSNSYGYRDDNWDPHASTTNIMVIGDSFVEGVQVEKDERFTERMAHRLEAQGHTVRVMNFGISGSSPDNYLLVLKKWYPVFKPALVVIAIFDGNDFDGINFTVTPNSGRVNYLVTNKGVMRVSDSANTKEKLIWDIKTFTGQFYLVQLAYDFLTHLKYGHINAAAGHEGEATSAPLYCDTQSIDTTHSYTIMKTLLKKMQEIAGDSLVVLDIPDGNEDSISLPNCDPTMPTHFFSQLAAQDELQVIHLIDHLTRPIKDYYFPGPGHLNLNGHAVVTSLLTDYADTYLFDKKTSPNSTTSTTSITR